MDSKVIKKVLWAVLISIVFMVFLLLRVEWKHFSLITGRIDIEGLLAACGVFALGNLARSYRFKQLDHTNKKLTHWWNINGFYNFLTATLPGGAGEAATAYVLKRLSMFNLLSAFRILLLSRVLDMFAISALFLTAALLISAETPYREAAVWISGTLLLVSLLALVPASEQYILRLFQKLPGNIFFIKKVCERLHELLEISKDRRDVRHFVITLIQSALTAIGGITTLYMLLRSFGFDFTFAQSMYCYGVYAVFQIIPVQGIAGIGTQAAWWALALNAAGYSEPEAIAMGFILYGIFLVFISVLGLSALLLWFAVKRTV
jgi:hypothetical protein